MIVINVLMTECVIIDSYFMDYLTREVNYIFE